MARAYDYRTLMAIDGTYKKWARALELWVGGDYDEMIDVVAETCPLCRFADNNCSKCAWYLEMGDDCCKYEPYINVVRGVCETDDFEQILNELDRLWELVRGKIDAPMP